MGLLGSLLGSDGGSGQAAAAAEANRINKEMYNQTRKDLSGYRDFGQTGLDQLTRNMPDMTKTFQASDMQKDPGYDFRMQEGQKALERSASARGGLMSGGTLKALSRYGQDYASNEYDKAYGRFNQDRDQRYGKLMDAVGVGQNAATQTGNAGQNYANNYGQNVTGAANARAAAGVAEGSALTGLIGQGLMAGAMFSDVRLKKNIRRLKESLFKDAPTYSYEYIDPRLGTGRQVGVMAQDLLAINPKHPAVILDESGFYKVNYSKLEAV